LENNKPEKKFKCGAITATVWNNKGLKDGTVYEYKTVSVVRNYKDSEGNWKTTNSMSPTDLPKLSLVCQKAFEYTSFEEVDQQQNNKIPVETVA